MVDLKTFQNYQGVTGKIVLDQSWNDIGDIFIAEVKQGKFVFSVAPPFDVKKKVSSKTGNY
jgi:hypothetical protein